jgi:hypothetical protein
MLGRSRAPRRSLAAGVLAAAGVLFTTVGPAQAADFPAKDSRYHSYSEMVTEIKAVAAAHPSIVSVFSIGKSYQGRDLWAAKISDHVGTDEDEPEVLFDALHHAREHMTVEQALYLFHLLVDGYGADAQITNLVDSREIWIIFAVNPDGFVYDLTCTGSSHPPYCAWRKNRQPNAGSSAIGTDLNRNYGYRFGCCGGSSSNPANIEYRGAAAWSAPETRAIRDFVLSRVVGGIQQIKAHITFHTNGKLVLWPYGYTTRNLPTDMTALDQKAFVAMGRAMAARNGYTPQQSSDLYVTDGDQIDWLYGAQRIFSFTWELYPPETATVWGDHYPPDETIASATANNRSALLWFLAVAACPYGAIGQTAEWCGPFYDDFEIARGWQVNPYGTDTATTGAFQRGDPSPTSSGGVAMQADRTASGRAAMVTGLAAGASVNSYDLDGQSTIRSRPFTIPADIGTRQLAFRVWWAHGVSSKYDSLKVYLEDTGGTRTLVWAVSGTSRVVAGAWRDVRVPIANPSTRVVRIVVIATDGGPNSTVEAGIDDIRITRDVP